MPNTPPPNPNRNSAVTLEEIEAVAQSFLENPIDVWWRKKYSIPFGSAQHREITHADQMIDYIIEHKLDRLKDLDKKKQDDRPMEDDFDIDTVYFDEETQTYKAKAIND